MSADDKDLYEAEIKKAYMRLALKLHPDKNPGDEEAKSKFQALQRIYAVLKDPSKRKAYDQTGSLDDSEALAGEQFDSLYEYYRNIYKEVSEEAIEEVEEGYRGSEEEKEDVLKFYMQFKGNMDKAFEWIICSEAKQDSHRFMDMIEEAVSKKKVKRFKAFTAWAKEVQQKPRPPDPLKPRKKSKKGGAGKAAETSLVAAIRNKGKTSFGGVLAAMEAKYGEHPASASGEPTEEEFQAAAARIQGKKQKRAKQKENSETGQQKKKKKQRQ